MDGMGVSLDVICGAVACLRCVSSNAGHIAEVSANPRQYLIR